METPAASTTSEPNPHANSHWKDLQEIDSTSRIMRTTIDKLNNYGYAKLGFTPYDWQALSAAAVINGNDVLCVTRTGDGKSVLFQLLTAYPNSTQIVISPLLGLIDEQVAFMNSIGVAAVALTGDNLSHEPELWKDINNGKYRVLFASPEMLLTPASYFWHKMAPNAKTNKFLKRLSAFIIDEAHMIWKWGESGFRTSYRNIGNLKTYFPKTPFLLLSATIAPNVRGYIHKSVGLAEPTYIMKRTIERPNIRLVCGRVRASNGSWKDLDFIFDSAVVNAMIPKTMIFVDNRTDAQHIATYLRTQLPDRDDALTAVRVYTAAYPPNTRSASMELFLTGDCRIMVCTDAAGMGMNIPNVQIVIQYKLTENVTLADVWQRLGRCARDPSIKGLGLILVDEKYILPANFAEDESTARDENWAAYTSEVTFDNRQEVKRFISTLYKRDPKAGSAYFKLDPALLWIVNTYGCRTRVVLAAFEDPNTYSAICRCDNCTFPPRTDYNRNLPPQQLTIRPGQRFPRGERAKVLEQMRQQNQGVVAQRQASITPFQNLGNECCHGFRLNRSLRYEDTAAYHQDEVDAELARSLGEENASRTPQALLESLTMRLQAARDQWYLQLDLEPRGVSKEVFFANDSIKKLAKASMSIKTAADIDRALGAKFHLDNSLIAMYAAEVLRHILDAVLEYQQQLQLREPQTQDQRQSAKKAPPARRKRKYDVEPIPEEQFDMSNPADVERLNRQRQLQEYDQAVDERRNERQQASQLKQAEQAVDKRSQQKVNKKQAATTRTKGSGKAKNTGNK
jgi:superfamily II DNA helicase RecQ